MPACPYCQGEGGYDHRDTDAYLAEHLTDAQLANVEGYGQPWTDCDECEATGVVSPERQLEIEAAARASVDQAIAEYNNRVAAGFYESDEAAAEYRLRQRRYAS
jgi:DnaJ-class molecular chaperone